ncbi:MAG: hypothetical protein JO186_02465 [Actinobacteria bacterium]|nr:hypothetical protein [Actinomycetota bacterium]
MATKHRLLSTTSDAVPPGFAQEVVDFARSRDAVRAAYVGLTEITEDFHEPYEQLAAAFELAEEDDASLQVFAEQFYADAPADLQAGGCNVLDAGGLAVWQRDAQRVFSR